MKTVPVLLCFLSAASWCAAAGPSPSYASLPIRGAISTRYTSVVISKVQNNKKHKIRFSAGAHGENLLFSVNGLEGGNYQLFLFDMDSRLVLQAGIRNREISALNNISKGNYLFHVLMNDEEVESGQLTIK